MTLDFPSLKGINAGSKAYKGKIVMLSCLDSTLEGGRAMYECGHRASVLLIFRPPKVMKAYFERRQLLATTGGFEDVILFDRLANRSSFNGYREMSLCPACFFEKHMRAMGPTCPACLATIKRGTPVILRSFKDEDRRLKRSIKVMRVKFGGKNWAVCCCPANNSRVTAIKGYVWNGETLVNAAELQLKMFNT